MASVLLIDDCPDFRAWARCTLEREGLEVIEARDALAGLQRAVEDRPDCVIVAAALPGLDGLDVARRIADEPATTGLPVLVSCELADAALRRAVMAVGARVLHSRTSRAADLIEPVRDALWTVGGARLSEEARPAAEPAAL
ncbi:MAG: response regulator [bacterium]|nr:response regulator [bacterium]